MLESFQSQGMPYNDDMFTTGATAHGCGHVTRTHYKGVRTTGADFVTNEHHRDNIEILVNTVVDRVNIRHTDNGLHAHSVDLIGPDGTRRTVNARRKIIVSGGAFRTPPILMRSGIDSSTELQKHNIETIVDAPGVGQNLLDDLIVFVFYETEKEGLTTDHHVYHGDALATAHALWKKEKAGFLSTFPFGALAFARLDDRLKDEPVWKAAQEKVLPGRDPMGLTKKQPNIEFLTTECYGGPKQYDRFPVNDKLAFAMVTELNWVEVLLMMMMMMMMMMILIQAMHGDRMSHL
jgi:choline dehydrogenase-like flavoprotein